MEDASLQWNDASEISLAASVAASVAAAAMASSEMDLFIFSLTATYLPFRPITIHHGMHRPSMRRTPATPATPSITSNRSISLFFYPSTFRQPPSVSSFVSYFQLSASLLLFVRSPFSPPSSPNLPILFVLLPHLFYHHYHYL